MPGDNTVRFISSTDPLFEQATALRWRVLFEPHGVGQGIDFDDAASDTYHAVVVAGNRVLGYGRLQRRDGEFQIRHLCVDPAQQGGGIGTLLLKTLIDRARQERGRKIFLNARFTALGLYRRFGFAEVGPMFHTEHTHLPHKRMELTL